MAELNKIYAEAFEAAASGVDYLTREPETPDEQKGFIRSSFPTLLEEMRLDAKRRNNTDFVATYEAVISMLERGEVGITFRDYAAMEHSYYSDINVDEVQVGEYSERTALAISFDISASYELWNPKRRRLMYDRVGLVTKSVQNTTEKLKADGMFVEYNKLDSR